MSMSRATSPESTQAPGYDAFVSYSHAADGLLAPRLQAALQRFAKPWWKRRALRIFRDDASLTANPHLWASLTGALDDSGWFILLMSPEAVASEWVNREIEYWLEHKDPNRIIPVLTEGAFAWTDGGIVSSAAPPALAGAFAEEPRWVDLRAARTDAELDLNNAGFRSAVADIAAAVRGVPKDELESEEVRQHRRTVRTAWAAAGALLVLTIAAIASTIYAADQRNEVAGQRDQIAGQRDEIAAQRDLAQQNEVQALAFASQLIDYVNQRSATDAPNFGDPFISILPDLGPSSLRYRATPPDTARLDFLQDFCRAGGCFRDAQWVHPTQPVRTGTWNAYAPFHIRHGFVNADPPGASAPIRVTVDVYIARREGPDLGPDVFPIDQWYRFSPDYVVREITDHCGPGYQTQTEPVECDLYVHDFPDGLPPGRYSIFVQWRAPCATWFEASVCDRPSDVMSLFDSQVNSAFLAENFTEDWAWPHDLWSDAEPNP
jgi:TIR domain